MLREGGEREGFAQNIKMHILIVSQKQKKLREKEREEEKIAE
jgi:hypothetical protein